MISYGSLIRIAEMLALKRSHQLGEDQSINTGMSGVVHPSQLVYGSQILIAETLWGKRSHQLGEGHRCGAAMPTRTYPPRPVYGSQQYHTEMSYEDCSHQLGKGHLWKHKCQANSTLPDQFTGAVIITQQCPWRNAPTYLPEAITVTQQC